MHILLYPGECESAGVESIRSFYVELRRDDGVSVQRCFTPMGQLSSVAALEKALAENFVFDDLPAGGNWTFWIVGSSDSCNSTNATLTMCGRPSTFALGENQETLNVVVDCEYPFTDQATLNRIKGKIRNCMVGFRPLPQEN